MAITNKMYENKKLRLNVALRGHRAGSFVRIRVDKNGIPHDQYWRNRLKDSAIDGCVEILSKPKKRPIETKEVKNER